MVRIKVFFFIMIVSLSFQSCFSVKKARAVDIHEIDAPGNAEIYRLLSSLTEISKCLRNDPDHISI
jgi:hypothetical protein